MSVVFTGATVSLDGYIADPNDGVDHLFGWYGNGEVSVPTAHPNITMQMTPASAEYWQEVSSNTGAIVVGRRLFDMTQGWGGQHPLGIPVVVLTHSVPDGWPRADAKTPCTFVHDGIEAAIKTALDLAGGKWVGVNGGEMANQALKAGLIDEIRADFVPVILGEGIPFFGTLKEVVELENPTKIVEGDRVTHLHYRVVK